MQNSPIEALFFAFLLFLSGVACYYTYKAIRAILVHYAPATAEEFMAFFEEY